MNSLNNANKPDSREWSGREGSMTLQKVSQQAHIVDSTLIQR